MTEEYQKRVDDLVLRGNKLRKEVLDSCDIKIPDFTKMRPGEFYDPNPYLASIRHRDLELSAKISDFKVSY